MAPDDQVDSRAPDTGEPMRLAYLEEDDVHDLSSPCEANIDVVYAAAVGFGPRHFLTVKREAQELARALVDASDPAIPPAFSEALDIQGERHSDVHPLRQRVQDESHGQIVARSANGFSPGSILSDERCVRRLRSRACGRGPTKTSCGRHLAW